ncbi:MAG: SurA N-terminal domain-containing protein [Acidobacteriota bacterium]|nr:SurA N-terminal domain-containing protein [Acidobacteriota bacterium]
MNTANSLIKRIFFAGGLLFLTLALFVGAANAQTVVDKTVATIGDGIGNPELITYSDLLWALALQSGVPLNPPSSEDLNRALQLLINQRLFALEAERVPRAAPTGDEIDAEIKRVLAQFSSTAEFEKRLRLVGFNSVKDENFERMMAQRVSIEKYLDFRFRSFVVITPEDESKYYRSIYVPEFRKKNPGLLMPPLDEKRSEINRFLTEEKVESDIEKFLDFAKRRNEIIILSAV